MHQSSKNFSEKIKAIFILLLVLLMMGTSIGPFGMNVKAEEIPSSANSESTPSSEEPITSKTTVATETTKATESQKPSEPSNPTTRPTEPSPQKPAGTPYLLIGENAIIKGKVGEQIALKLPLVNIGTADAVSVTASPQLAVKDDEFPFVIEKSEYIGTLKGNLSPIKSLSEISSGTKMIDFGKLTLRDNLETGYYKVTFKINYMSAFTNQYEQIERYFFIKAENPNNSSSDIEEPPFDPNNNFDPGSYTDGGYIGGDYIGSEEESKSTPRLMVSGFTTSPEKLFGGKDFTLHLKLKNTSKTAEIKNIKLTFSSQGEEAAVFLPVDGASTMYIEKIDKDTEKEIAIKLKSNSSVEQKIYPLDLKFEYEDKNGNPYTAEEMVSLMLYQELRCDIGKIEIMPNPINVNNEANVMFSIFNKGKSTLHNLSIIIPEDGVLEGNEIFIGNVEAGTSKDVDFMIRAIGMNMEPEVPFQITFEDAEGNVTSLDQKMELTITEESFDDGFNGEWEDPVMGMEVSVEDESSGPSLWLWIGLGVLGLIVLIIIIKILKKKKQRKEQAEIDEMV